MYQRGNKTVCNFTRDTADHSLEPGMLALPINDNLESRFEVLLLKFNILILGADIVTSDNSGGFVLVKGDLDKEVFEGNLGFHECQRDR